MTRINTNVSSLVGRNNLNKANDDLNQALARLSTGLRINSGKDDPAGLIASENLRSDITSIERAITNTERADQVIATADSSLGEVSSLLNDIRGLVTESANEGALSDAQVAANQAQVDSSLDAINRIAQTTEFQGRKLLDGSLDFNVTAGANFANIGDLNIDQANLGTIGSKSVDINVTAAAEQAQVDVAGIPTGGIATAATSDVVFDTTATGTASTGTTANFTVETQAEAQGSATITVDTTNNGTFAVTAVDGGAAEASEFDGAIAVTIADGTTEGVVYNDTTNTLAVTVDITNGNNTVADLAAVINASGDFSVNIPGITDGTDTIATSNTGAGTATGGQDQVTATETIDIQTLTDATGQDLSLTFTAGVAGVVDNGSGSYTITYDAAAGLDGIVTQIEGITGVDATGTAITGATSGSAAITAGPVGAQTTTGYVADSVGDGTISLTAVTAGAAGNGATVTVTESDAATIFALPSQLVFDANGVAVDVDGGTGNISVYLDNTETDITLTDIAAAIDLTAEYSATTTEGSENYNIAGATPPTGANSPALAGGADGGGLANDLVLELGGLDGSEVLSFDANTSITALVSGINAVSDSTGVTARANDDGTTLELLSADYGENAFVDVTVVKEGGTGSNATGPVTTAIGSGDRDEGVDIQATVNGIAANGNGNTLSINTSTLDLNATLDADFVGTASFTIDGGGATFQLGPDVVSNQQATLGIGSVNTATLGGISGLLFELGAGESADLSTDATRAAKIVEEAIDEVTSLRGRLGAFQRTTLESNKNALNDTLVNLTETESSIRDADFAAETAEYTRASILVQSTTQVLAISNQNPQNVLSLLPN